MKKTTPILLTLIVLLVILPLSGVLAQEPPVQDPGPLDPYPMLPTPTPVLPDWYPGPVPEPPVVIEPPIWRMEGLEIPYQRVDVTIDGQVATTHIEQLFRNKNDWLLEGNYFFPLPPGAAVSQLTMWVNGEPIEAKILKKEEARGIYDEIVRQLRDPALLEYVGTDAIQANVFPIPPGEERLVEIEYSYLLPAENGLIHYRYPQTADLYTNAPLGEQSIRVEVTSEEPIRTIYSPSHKVAVNREGEFEAVVGYEASNVTPDQDFELYYTVSSEAIGLNLLTYKEPGEDGFFLMLVTPGIETAGSVAVKDVILVLDTSGSMEGVKLAQAQEAASYVVEHLNAGDRFNIVSFSTGTNLYEPELVPADDAGVFEQFINSLEAVGGTNISGALLEAAALVDDERPATIIFLTDGLATEGIDDTPMLLESVAAQMPENARIFSFGVGNDVDTMLLDTLAQNHRGVTTYVRPGQAIDEAVSGFYAKVSSPVLTDISLDMGDIRTSQVYPAQLPDLFAGTQLVVSGRYRDGGVETITLRGTVNGEEQVFRFDDQRFLDEAPTGVGVPTGAGGGEPFIPRLWATRAIGHMMQQIRLRGEDEELVQSIVNLSTRYGIITPYTSFLIEEDDIFEQIGDQPRVVEALVVEDSMMEEAEAALAVPTQVSGEMAVERAAMEQELAAAEAVVVTRVVTETQVVEEGKGSPPAAGQQPVVSAGRKTFFLRNGILVDSAFSREVGQPVVIPFASDAYFELLSDWPEAGEYLALGEEILVVLGGQAFQITAADVETAVEVQTAAQVDSGETPDVQVDSGLAPAAEPSYDGYAADEAPAAGWQVWGLGLALLLFVVSVVGLGILWRRKM
jgi:Ca-activated chloride channel homolog